MCVLFVHDLHPPGKRYFPESDLSFVSVCRIQVIQFVCGPVFVFSYIFDNVCAVRQFIDLPFLVSAVTIPFADIYHVAFKTKNVMLRWHGVSGPDIVQETIAVLPGLLQIPSVAVPVGMFVITILLFIFNRIVIDPEFVDHVGGVRHLRRVKLHLFFRVFYTRRQIRSAWTQLDCDAVKSIAGQKFSIR